MEDVIQSLTLRNPLVVVTSFNRENLFFVCRTKSNMKNDLQFIVDRCKSDAIDILLLKHKRIVFLDSTYKKIVQNLVLYIVPQSVILRMYAGIYLDYFLAINY
jgi:hypothetical protein